MPRDTAQRASLLIDDILIRYHEAHRQALPDLVALARSLQSLGVAPGLADQAQVLADGLEMHMMKEEMRLFPMMEQGGHTLLAHLIDDLEAEHVQHRDALILLQSRVAGLAVPPHAEATHAALRHAVDALATELKAHVCAEDEVLFPLFTLPALG